MANTVRVFDFEKCNVNGPSIVATRSPLTPGCVSEAEVDAQVRLLKEDLDATARRMKRYLQEQSKRPILPR